MIFYIINRRSTAQIGAALGLLSLILACTPAPAVVEEQYYPDTSVDEYARTIGKLSLDQTNLGERWVRASQVPSTLPGLTLLPHAELRHFDDAVPEGAWLLIEAVRGHRVTITLEPDSPMAYFADLFGLEGDVIDPISADQTQISLAPVASAHFIETDKSLRQGPSTLVFEPRGTRFYLLRILPRLLEGGTISITMGTTPLASVWPVDDTERADIWSFFGDPRDGGARVHHGVDIFAPRGTPIRAPIAGRITRIGDRTLGGLSVSMMDDDRRLMLYFAHLDTYGDIAVNQIVEAGHILGTVGNTGNAITTPPHLHLGIYDRGFGGPVDPWYFIMPPTSPTEPEARALKTTWQKTLERYPLGSHFAYHAQAIVNTRNFFAQALTQALIRLSPAKRDAAGEELETHDRPYVQLPWLRPYQGTVAAESKETIRLVAVRDQALGFAFPDGTLYWSTLSQASEEYLARYHVESES